MQVTVEVPDHIVNLLGERANLEREVLEAFAADAYRAERLSRKQVGDLLGFDYWEMEDFLTRHDAKRPFTLADLQVDRKNLGDK